MSREKRYIEDLRSTYKEFLMNKNAVRYADFDSAIDMFHKLDNTILDNIICKKINIHLASIDIIEARLAITSETRIPIEDGFKILKPYSEGKRLKELEKVSDHEQKIVELDSILERLLGKEDE